MYENFPQLTGEPEQLVTWRASCAETPPYGPDPVILLCEAPTVGSAVFYWLKAADDGGSSGFVSCP